MAAQTAITVPLQEQVSKTGKIALSRATLVNATLLTTSGKKPRIRSRRSSLLKGNFRTDRLGDVLTLTVYKSGDLLVICRRIN